MIQSMRSLCTCIFLFAFTCLCAQGYQVGDTVTDFSLKNVDGTMVSLKDYGDDVQGYVVIFTCNHCPYAKMYEQRFIDFHHKFAPNGWPIVAINPNNPQTVPDDSFEAMVARAQELKIPYAYLFDEGQKVYPVFGATRTPHIFLLDKNLKVRYIGAMDDNCENPDEVKQHYLLRAIEAIQAGSEPDPSFTKAIGCSIKK
jgi:peroxiredoxin